jgi:acyl-coenzyme A synthetase/AMP-(fatty) acid ligase
MTFPMHVGAATVLHPDRPTSESVRAVLREHLPTLFGGVPTLYAALLADPALDPSREGQFLRGCISAGEALPADIGERWKARFGIDILDGLGSTEMLHIFLSNRFGEVRAYSGATWAPVPLTPGHRFRWHLGTDSGRPGHRFRSTWAPIPVTWAVVPADLGAGRS